MKNGKAWKNNRKPQGINQVLNPKPAVTNAVSVPKLGAATSKSALPPKVPNGRKGVMIYQAAFCNCQGSLGLVMNVGGQQGLVCQPVSRIDLGNSTIACGKDTFILDPQNFQTQEQILAKVKARAAQEEQIAQLGTELREVQKENLQLRAMAKGQQSPKQPNRQKANIF